MLAASSPLALAADALAVGASAAFLALAWSRRGRHGARPLLALAAVLLAGSLAHAVLHDLAPTQNALNAALHVQHVGGLWIIVAYNVVASADLLWTWFALRYSGRAGRETPVALAATALTVGVLFAVTGLTVAGGRPALSTSIVNAVAGLVSVIAESLVAVGVFLVAFAAVRYEGVSPRRVAPFVGGAVVLAAVPLAASISLQPLVVPAGYAAASSLFAVSLARGHVLRHRPTAAAVGRDRVVADLEEGVVVVGDDGAVRDCNAAAADLLDADADEVVGSEWSAALPSLPEPDGLTDDDPVRVTTPGDRTLALTADRITDGGGGGGGSGVLGHLVVCRDVTERRNRERRLTVLTRLLVEAVGDRMAAVTEDAEAVREDDADDREAAGDRIWTAASELATLVARTREVERALAATPDDGPVDAVAVARTVADRADADLDVPDEPVVVDADRDLLSAALGTLLAGALAPETRQLSVRPDGTLTATGSVPGSRDGGEGVHGAGGGDEGTESGGGGTNGVPGLAAAVAELAAERAGGEADVSLAADGTRTATVSLPLIDGKPETGSDEADDDHHNDSDEDDERQSGVVS